MFISSDLLIGYRKPGYSKDVRFKECQVLLALAVTETGLPVRYTVLPGARFEGHSLVPVVKALQARPVSPKLIANALTHVRHGVPERKRTQRRYVIPSAVSETGRQLCKVMGLRHSTTPYEL